MNRAIQQFTTHNNEIKAEENILKGYSPVVKLGIQAPPNTAFHLNGGNTILVDAYGIYEINLESTAGRITSLRFPSVPENQTIIVDIVYEVLGG